MARHIINNVQAVSDAVDRLVWEVDVGTDFFGTHYQLAYALFWDGQVVFWREPFPPGNTPGPQTPRKNLAARWVNRDVSARMTVPNPRRFEFASDLPGDALDRLDDFREGGRLFARVEGKLVLVIAEPSREGQGSVVNDMLFDLGQLMTSSNRLHSTAICTDPKELSRDTWGDAILAKLRPQGRHVLEVTIPIGSTAGDVAAVALQQQRAAQRAFDEGRYEETMRACAHVLDQINLLLNRADAAYGKLGLAHIGSQIVAAKSLCDAAHLAGKSGGDGVRADRTLAHHVLIVTSSLFALATS